MKRLLPLLLMIVTLFLCPSCDDTATNDSTLSVYTTTQSTSVITTTTAAQTTVSEQDADPDATKTEGQESTELTDVKTTTATTTAAQTTVSEQDADPDATKTEGQKSTELTDAKTTTATTTLLKEPTIDRNGSYTTKEDVALYIHTYGCLPSNFITKKEAQALGWEGGSLEPYAPGKCIGGNYFGNYEGLLPEKSGRTYTECDIDTLGAKSRGAKRIVFSNDGLIYYTADHYETFELLYGEEDS